MALLFELTAKTIADQLLVPTGAGVFLQILTYLLKYCHLNLAHKSYIIIICSNIGKFMLIFASVGAVHCLIE